MARSISRRTMLRGAGGVALGLPMLEIMDSHAGGGGDPTRMVIFFTNNGTVHSNWTPTGSETDFTLGPILQPLAPFQDRLNVLSGVDQESSYHGPGSGDPHMPGMAHLLTGTEMVSTGTGNYDKMGGGISVDQYVAEQINAPTKFGSLQFGVQAGQYASNAWNSLTYAGPNEPVAAENDPVEAYNRIFGELDGDQGALAVLRAKRHSVLDAVKDDLTELQGRLGAADNIKLEQHLDAVRDVETIIDTSTDVGGNCMVPDVPAAVANLYDYDAAPALFRAQIELLVMSLVCDLTRVASLQFRAALGGTMTFTFLGQTEEWHEISHKGDGNQQGVDEKTAVNTWFAEQFAYLLQLMDAVQETNGSLLDNSVVFWCNELSRGNAHSRRDMPFLLAGSAGGYFPTGRWLQYNGASHNDLLVSLANSMGVQTNTFGNPAYCTGPLSGLV
ncbi:MAG: DUF1552 domain-containing protein [Myxococcota bacterium]